MNLFFNHSSVFCQVYAKLSKKPSMDSNIKLVATKRQMAFLGPVMNKQLQQLSKISHPLLLDTICNILGVQFLIVEHRYRVNIDIPTHFLATLLYLGEPKVAAQELCERVFKPDCLYDLTRTTLHPCFLKFCGCVNF